MTLETAKVLRFRFLLVIWVRVVVVFVTILGSSLVIIFFVWREGHNSRFGLVLTARNINTGCWLAVRLIDETLRVIALVTI